MGAETLDHRHRSVGVVGLGNIGGGVATNLLAAGHHVVVNDLDSARVDALVAAGATAGTTADAAATEAVFTSLPGPPQLRSVGLEPDGIVANLKPDCTWIDLSTNDSATAHDLHTACRRVGAHFVDAPVSGGPEGAAAGTLSLFVGGSVDDVAAVRPLLEAIGSRIFHVGPVGAGLAAKIAQVTLCYTQTVALTEALVLGTKAGVDPAMMLEIIQQSAGRSYVSDVYGPEILAGTYDASFPVGHAAKDMGLADDLAAAVGAELPMIADVRALYDMARERFGPAAPHLMTARLREETNGVTLRAT
ncbi:MAG: NAD(P)-dependent oxidoreductase, partial [Acidimicrobiia bacterium]|nr:NAD(P)-dependent oxidoreductase [Acidimicrobiia bacterium]